MESNIVGPTAKNYRKLKQFIHVYKKPSTYIGDPNKELKKDWLYSFSEGKGYKGSTDIPDGVERLFIELIMNAADNIKRSKDLKINPGVVRVKMNNMEISVYNEGLPIPVEKNEEGIYVPEMIFGELLTSSNYDSENEDDMEEELKTKKIDGAGTNGIGAKAVNIFSTFFKIIIHDHIRKLKYTQVWKNNMHEKEEPEITPYKGRTSSVEVVYHMDFKRFKYDPVLKIGNPFTDEEVSGGYTKDVFEIFARHSATLSWACKIPVHFNDITFNIKNVKEYGKVFYGDAVDTGLVYYQWPSGTEVKFSKKKYFQALDLKVEPLIEVLVLDAPDKGEVFSYVNANITREGGTHVDAIWSVLGKKIVKTMKEKMKLDKTENNKLTIGDIKPHLTLFVSFVGVNRPGFDSQSKNKLRYPKQKELSKDISIPEESFNIINNWMLYKRLSATLKLKNTDLMKESDGVMKKYLGKNKKVVEANYAGDRKIDLRISCTLYLCEGDSASTYIDTKMSLMDRGRDRIGYIPLRGKGLNVMNANEKQLNKNEEIKQIKKYLGLVEGTDYSIDSNYHNLRYGKVCILADSDDDGLHIIGLTILYFYFFFPSLLQRDFLYYEKTPLVRITKGKQIHKFYSLYEYENWKKNNDSTGWKANFFKGLASSTDDNVEDDLQDPKIIKFILDPESSSSLDLAFKRQLSNERKSWISNYNGSDTDFSTAKEQEITKFINQDFIQYSIITLSRAIPKLMDGLKEAQRKILQTAYKKWNISCDKDSYNEFKVAQFQGSIADITKYEHGEQNLETTIINMIRNFPGTNNIPLLQPLGQFGSRMDAKKKTSGRYIFTAPQIILPFIFRMEDKSLLTYRYEENIKIEPVTFLPIIPMILVNGCLGLATGHSTFIPNFNPLQIIEWIRQRINDVDENLITEVNPWYYGHTGTIKIIDRRNKKKRGNRVKVTTIKNDADDNVTVQTAELNDVFTEDDSSNLLDDSYENKSEENLDPMIGDLLDSLKPEESRPLLTMISYGEYYVQDGKIIITELPIGIWTKDYEDELDDMITEKKIKTKYVEASKQKVYIEITGFQGPINHKTLKLVRSYGMSNMVLLDNNCKPVRYDTQYEILEEFYDQRLPYYYERRKNLINKLKNEIDFLSNKEMFITSLLEKKILIQNEEEDVIRKQYLNAGIKEEYFDKFLGLPLKTQTKAKVNEILNDVVVKKKELEVLESKKAQDLWIDDLNDLEREYKKYLENEKSKTNKKIPASKEKKKKTVTKRNRKN